MSDLGGEKLGLKTAVEDALAASGGAMPSDFMPVEQLEMLPLRKAETGDEAETRLTSGTGKGRPLGSKNRRTQEMADYLLSRYTSPLIALAEAYSRPVQDLAKELCCSKEEAFKLQMAAAKELAPYIHQKMPQAVDLGEAGLIALTIDMRKDDKAIEASDGFSLEIIDVKSENRAEENQTLSDHSAPMSNAAKSNDEVESA